MKPLIFALVLAATALASQSARAIIVYQYVADTTSFTGPTGSTFDDRIYLQETVSGGSSSFIASQGGLLSGAWEINLASGNAFVSAIKDSATLATDTFGFYGGTATPFGTLNSSGNLWRLSESSNATYDAVLRPTNPNSLGIPNGAVTTVYLGTATFTVGTTISTMRLGNDKAGPFTAPWKAGAAVNLDVDNPPIGFLGAGDNTFTITINPISVPEPSSLALGVLAAGGIALGAWRRCGIRRAG